MCTHKNQIGFGFHQGYVLTKLLFVNHKHDKCSYVYNAMYILLSLRWIICVRTFFHEIYILHFSGLYHILYDEWWWWLSSLIRPFRCRSKTIFNDYITFDTDVAAIFDRIVPEFRNYLFFFLISLLFLRPLV